MKFLAFSASDVLKTSAVVKIAGLVVVSVTLILLLNSYYSSEYSPLTFSNSLPSPSSSSLSHDVTAPSPSPYHPVVNGTEKLKKKKVFRPPPLPPVERMGIVDENGAMSLDFKVGEFNSSLVDELDVSVDGSGNVVRDDGTGADRIKFEKFNKCDRSFTDYIPCLDNLEAIMRFNSSDRGEKYERHCPEQGKGLNCLVPLPKGYRIPITWPQSRDEVWFNNVPHTRLVEDKGGQNWIKRDNDKFIFPGGGTQFIHGADQYLNQISEMVPDVAFGYNTRVALDIGCGVASFGAFLMPRNVTTLSIAPKDVHENQVQFALERGVPAMVAVFATRRLLFPSQAFDLIHCSRCRINWTRDDGILLLETDRLLRAGGYFVWAAQPVYKNEDILHEQWKEMVNLTARICWELVKKEGYIAIWRKPLNNSCYLNRGNEMQPPLCDSNDDPDNVWYVDLKACITRLPENGYGTNVTKWPLRLHLPPERLQTIKIDGFLSRKELFKAESKYWNEIIDSYVRAFRWKTFKMRNVLDMRAGYGGFAAAMHDLGLDCWIMNVVPVSGFNTLPVIYDRGLVGVMHDWCEPFDTYPRTYDLLHASGLFSVEKKRNKCSLSTIMLEMERMLRPDAHVYIRDMAAVISELHEIGTAMAWQCAIHDTGEGPHASWKILICEKRM